MQWGVNVPNFGPGTDPGVLRDWAHVVEGLGFDLLMVSDHVAVTPDVAARYPEPFHEPFTTLSWLAAQTRRVRLGTTVLVLPYRHPLLVARMAANLQAISDGRLVLGVGVGWARQEFAALGVPHAGRGRLTDQYLAVLREPLRAEGVPVWVGGDSPAALARAARYGDAWHPLRLTLPAMRDVLDTHPLPGFAPRITLRLTDRPATGPERPAGTGTLEQVLDDLDQLRRLGAEAVVLDPYHGDPEQTRRPQDAWRDLTALSTHRRTAP
ncbi:LLM class flavin-dependent oxidoreductase [Yinghuangia seranimata]|uniref:LLM class flavin-dependent oxidoreductase n=1 Tax=Yinghuangia seranimata TaxID=408067 RepID=UPI00248ABA61|nr:LLM class flavin-dependent oxidoreductase [Yinghuangia seranimata]MDI2127721.1 LLM class flavin-dependent oxidoreductase [Yinghuangia seranimata]